MTSKTIAQTNQQQKSEKTQASGILQRAAVRSVADAGVQMDEQEAIAISNSAFSKDFSQVPISTTAPKQKNTSASVHSREGETVQRQEISEVSSEDSGVFGEKKENKTGLPDNLKVGIENLSGYSMDDVRVYYNSSKPAQLQALAYTQGTDIYVAPGKEKTVPHEVGHVVQQKQGRVKPTMQMKGVEINDNPVLEREADVIGKRIAWQTRAHNDQKRKTDNDALNENAKTRWEARGSSIKGYLNTLSYTSPMQFLHDRLTFRGTRPDLDVMEHRASSGVIQRVMNEENVSLFNTFLDVYQGRYVYFKTKDLKGMPSSFIQGKNYRVADHKEDFLKVIKKNDNSSKMLLEKILEKDTRDDVLKKLEANHAFVQDKETAAENILSSSLFKKDSTETALSLEENDGGNHVAKVLALSDANVSHLETNVEKLKNEIKELQEGSTIIGSVDKFVNVVKTNYEKPVLAHASKAEISNQINSSTNRNKLGEFATTVRGKQGKQAKLTNTSPTNTKIFKSHDFVYLNVYPQMRDDTHKNQVLGGTRFLRENYALDNLPIAPGAHTYIYGMDRVTEEEQLTMLALRDPVYPSGGKTDQEGKARVQKNPYAEYISMPQEGSYKYKVGMEEGKKKEEYTYRTIENIFAGQEHITTALWKNVELGLYRVFVNLGKEDQNKLKTQIDEAINELGRDR